MEVNNLFNDTWCKLLKNINFCFNFCFIQLCYQVFHYTYKTVCLLMSQNLVKSSLIISDLWELQLRFKQIASAQILLLFKECVTSVILPDSPSYPIWNVFYNMFLITCSLYKSRTQSLLFDKTYKIWITLGRYILPEGSL